MSETKHTPGPWEAGVFHYKDVNQNIIAVQCGDRCICRISPLELRDSQDEADAQLISAAPDLLAVCGEWLEWLKQTPNPPDGWLAGVERNTRAAIAKAKGQK